MHVLATQMNNLDLQLIAAKTQQFLFYTSLANPFELFARLNKAPLNPRELNIYQSIHRILSYQKIYCVQLAVLVRLLARMI